MIDIVCPQCRTKLKVKDEAAGKQVRCPHCQRVQAVPLPPSSADDATLLPRGSPAPDETLAQNGSADRPADGATREVVTGAFAYQLEREIARGGMGAILRAVDPD